MVEKKIVLKFSEFGSVLATRKLGKKIRQEQIIASINVSTIIILDFNHVELLTHSFADECIGKILLSFDLVAFKRITRFVNYNEKVKFQIINTINQNIEKKRNTVQNNR